MRPTIKSGLLVRQLVTMALIGAFVTAPARAGEPDPKSKSALPPGMDLAALPVGGWCEYNVQAQGSAVRRTRYAVLARSTEEVVVEVVADGGPQQLVSKAVVQIKAGLTGSGPPKVTQRAMSLGAHPPEIIPNDKEVLLAWPLETKQLLGSETVALSKGKVSAKHYQRPWGEGSIEVWVNEKASPCRLVRTREAKPNGHLKEEIFVATGNGAISELAPGPIREVKRIALPHR